MVLETSHEIIAIEKFDWFIPRQWKPIRFQLGIVTNFGFRSQAKLRGLINFNSPWNTS